MEIEVTKRVVKVYVDGKHRKSFPLYLEKFVLEKQSDIDFVDKISKMNKSTVLKESDDAIIAKDVFDFLFLNFKGSIEKYEPHVYSVIKEGAPVGCRIVYPFNQPKRYEICFDNKLSARCDANLYRFANKLPDAFLNY